MDLNNHQSSVGLYNDVNDDKEVEKETISKVGVDPLMRQRVWEHILQLSRDRGTTTIITTHYVEEAKGAARVGFMRDGRLLAENSPAGLLQRHSATSLEAVFLSLCQAETECSGVVTATRESTTNSLQSLSQSTEPLCSDHDEKEQPSWTCPAPQLSNILALLIKNWITMKRNPVLLIFIFFLPGIFMILTCIS